MPPHTAEEITPEMLRKIRAEIVPYFETFVSPVGLAHKKAVDEIAKSGHISLAPILYFHMAEIEMHKRHILATNPDFVRDQSFSLLVELIQEIVIQDVDRMEERQAAEERSLSGTPDA
jgi:UDP-N-acetyl-D-mannosaminuronate dehydrogenase